MTPPGHSPTEAWHLCRMAQRQREMGRHWPLVLVALGVAVIFGLLSPDRSKSSPSPSPAPVASVR